MYSSDVRADRETPERVLPQQDRPVGWYRDREQPTGHRYWDGTRWLSEPDGSH